MDDRFWLRLVSYAVMMSGLAAAGLWTYFIALWTRGDQSAEPLTVVAAAILSTCVAVLSWVRTRLKGTGRSATDLAAADLKASVHHVGGNVIVAGGSVTVHRPAARDRPGAPVTIDNVADQTVDDWSIQAQKLDPAVGTKFVEGELLKMVEQIPKEQRAFAILMVDVDQLTQINGLFGRTVGDRVLREVLKVIATKAAVTYYGRCGDDTFYAVIRRGKRLPSWAHPGSDWKRTVKICEKIRRGVESNRWNSLAQDLRVTCTVGYSVIDFHETPASWVKRALYGLRNGKSGGGNKTMRGPDFIMAKPTPAVEPPRRDSNPTGVQGYRLGIKSRSEYPFVPEEERLVLRDFVS